MDTKLIVRTNAKVRTNQYKYNNYGFINYKIEGCENDNTIIKSTQDNVFLIGCDDTIPTNQTIRVKYNEIKKRVDYTPKINEEKKGFESNEILRSLISLASRSFKYENGNLKCIDNVFDKNILKWVRKYGLPSIGGPIMKCVTPETIEYINNWDKKFCSNESKSIEYIGYVGCNYDLLKTHIRRLYDVFLRLSSELYDDTTLLEIFKYISDNPYSKKGRVKNINEDENKRIDRIKRIINKSVANVKVNNEISFNGKDISMSITTDNLITLAFYQLILLFQTGQYKGMKKCDCCQDYFVVRHRNEKHCINCTPQKKYSRNERKKKKDGK